jgi:hypothetical protein
VPVTLIPEVVDAMRQRIIETALFIFAASAIVLACWFDLQ